MADYIKFDFQTKKLGLKEPVIRLYPFVCLHVGSEQCDMKFIKENIKRLKDDPNGRGVLLGDSGECVILGSKGDIYKQLLNPQQQQDVVVEIFESVRNKLLFSVTGNHGRRIFKATGLDFDANLAHRLGIPYMGVSAFCNIVVNRSSYDTFWHHGADSGTNMQSKITKAEKFNEYIDADALFTAHSHACIELHPKALLSVDNQNCKVKTKLRRGYVCGSAYDSRTGYAEEKAYSPILPAWLTVEFDGRIVEGRAQYNQHCEIYRSDGQHELKHDYIFRP